LHVGARKKQCIDDSEDNDDEEEGPSPGNTSNRFPSIVMLVIVPSILLISTKLLSCCEAATRKTSPDRWDNVSNPFVLIAAPPPIRGDPTIGIFSRNTDVDASKASLLSLSEESVAAAAVTDAVAAAVARIFLAARELRRTIRL
jgi:hypothetical protein